MDGEDEKYLKEYELNNEEKKKKKRINTYLSDHRSVDYKQMNHYACIYCFLLQSNFKKG